jgi:hypothetical protein
MWKLTGKYPLWYPDNLKLDLPVQGRWIATDFKQGVGGVFQPYFEDLVPASFIKHITRTQQGILSKVKFHCGSVLEILTDEQELNIFEGWHGDILHIDEPCARARYIASVRGLIDKGGKSSFSLTPLKEPWIYDELYSKADGKTIFQITVDIYQNPYLKKEFIDEFAFKLTDDEKEARLFGKFMHLSGLVYKEYDSSVHKVKAFEIPFDWKRICVLDPHDRKKHAVIWAAVDPFDSLYIYDELEIGGTLGALSEAIKIKENKAKIDLRIIDPNKGRSPSSIGKAGRITDELAKYKLYFWSGVNDSIPDGHLQVKHYLRYNVKEPISSTNKPKLYFFDTCEQTNYGMTHYVWDDFRDTESKDPKEKPKDLYKDFPDLVRYLCMAGIRYKSAGFSTRGRINSITGY